MPPAAPGKGQRVYLEAGSARILLQLRSDGAREPDLDATFGETQTEVEGRESGAGAPGLLDDLKDS
jgi:hypothetical protein